MKKSIERRIAERELDRQFKQINKDKKFNGTTYGDLSKAVVPAKWVGRVVVVATSVEKQKPIPKIKEMLKPEVRAWLEGN